MRNHLYKMLYLIIIISLFLFVGCNNKVVAESTPNTLCAEYNWSENAAAVESETISLDISNSANSSSAQFPSTTQADSFSNQCKFISYRPQDRGENFIETDSFYYYLNNGRIYFSEKTEPVFYLLCSKPNCTHGGEDCNAYGGGEGGALGYWDGKLYNVGFVNDELVLVRMDMDGSNHEVAAKIEAPLDSQGVRGGSYSFVFANDCLYYFISATPRSVFKVELNSGKTERLFRDLLANGESIQHSNLRFQDDSMFFLQTKTDGTISLWEYSTSNGDVRRISDWPNDIGQWDLRDGIAYYYDQADRSFCELALASGTSLRKEFVQLADNANYGTSYYDENYVYLVTCEDLRPTQYDFYIFDRDYYLLQHLSLPLFGDYLYAAGDKLFFSNTYSYKISHYLPFSEIGSEDAELHPVKDPYALR